MAVARWRARTGRPTVISTQGMLEPWAIRNSALRKRVAGSLFEKANLRESAGLHCSESEVAGIRAFGLTNPVAVIANGTEIPEVALSKARPAVMREGRRHLLF